MIQKTDTGSFDVVVIGGGIVGLSFANELAGSDFSVAVIERNELKAMTDEPDCRVSAINLSALKRYQQTGVLDSPLASRACAFEKMFVWDQTGAGQIEFDSAELGLPELGLIIENNVLQRMLLDNIQAADNISYLCPQEIIEIDYQPGHEKQHEGHVEGLAAATITLSSQQQLSARLLAGADGVNSKVREAGLIQRVKRPYQQQALVCNVATSESHQNTAWQCFMPSGPLAFLPLYNGWSSIVWSLDEDQAQQKMSLDANAFKAVLAEAGEYKLGEILETSQRFLFPLSHGHVTDYVRSGLALIGDAAHNIHPLAGQGANLGIADAFALADVIRDARKSGRQWAALHTLKKYQRQRKGANQLMEMSMTGFKELFGFDNAFISEIRNAGLSLVDHIPALKYRIIKQALGV
ncbi:MAG: UbiH/UbiF/VisC/COQ6 family ubiquinone biosynthesis hydroxylase [Gammaproteobacteria bacterium]|jgi:2-octaprenylphenol hydroxylase|nr:UbiH/UbiF/VisC/COQ6 family ubiquinone biosynthesis hydroxylase [Gammaproteobacteria bacterium]